MPSQVTPSPFEKKRGRKKKIRDINYTPTLTIWQPISWTKEPQTISLGHDELEAMRLKYVNGLGIITAAKQMKISKSLFANILNEALRKVSQALVFGRAMEIEIGQGEFLQPML
jgi:uncharacterized protein